MKTASILLALAAVLGIASVAGAADCTIKFGNWWFGFSDAVFEEYETDSTGIAENLVRSNDVTLLRLGKYNYNIIPGYCAATQCLIGFCIAFIGLAALAIFGTVRWRRTKRSHQ
jgi:hypothetical protein